MTNQPAISLTDPRRSGVPKNLLDLLQSRPQLATRFGHFQAAFSDQQLVPERLLAICRARIDALHRLPAVRSPNLNADDQTLLAAGDFSALSRTEVAALKLAEQLVIDAHGVTDEQVGELGKALGEPGAVTLLTAIALFDSNARMQRVLAPLSKRRRASQRTAAPRNEQ